MSTVDTHRTLNTIRSAIEKQPERIDAYQDYFDMLRTLKKESKQEAYDLNSWLRGVVTKRCKAIHEPRDIASLYELAKKTYLLPAQDNFNDYLIYMEWNRPVEKRFYQPRMHYLKPMVEGYQDVLDGKLDLLTISQPKRTGKSQTGINFVNMVSGRNPNGSTLMEGAGSALVNSFYKGCQEYLDPKSEYLFYDIFPESKLVGGSAEMKTINLDKNTRFPMQTLLMNKERRQETI